ncbi:hypothetical protein CA13_55390 [Planctomycetes bacterium CA13]|uniref:Uncharacterized protein n=1 Tax=Novipirellula herctigrandis TaxID=2527986 RepID=A0A5C5ZBX0_9BACT|nr:hypothetical protein CA13_55390 [Planctomycetes bacterium CA13]
MRLFVKNEHALRAFAGRFFLNGMVSTTRSRKPLSPCGRSSDSCVTWSKDLVENVDWEQLAAGAVEVKQLTDTGVSDV